VGRRGLARANTILLGFSASKALFLKYPALGYFVTAMENGC
jgi:hypothetical protein